MRMIDYGICGMEETMSLWGMCAPCPEALAVALEQDSVGFTQIGCNERMKGDGRKDLEKC